MSRSNDGAEKMYDMYDVLLAGIETTVNDTKNIKLLIGRSLIK